MREPIRERRYGSLQGVEGSDGSLSGRERSCGSLFLGTGSTGALSVARWRLDAHTWMAGRGLAIWTRAMCHNAPHLRAGHTKTMNDVQREGERQHFLCPPQYGSADSTSMLLYYAK